MKKKLVFSLLLTLALGLPLKVSAQVSSYALLATGVDATLWLTPDNEETLSVTQEDDGTTGVVALGFQFPFVGEIYTQFSANTNGRLRLGSVAMPGNEYNPRSTAASTASTCPKSPPSAATRNRAPTAT